MHFTVLLYILVEQKIEYVNMYLQYKHVLTNCFLNSFNDHFCRLCDRHKTVDSAVPGGGADNYS